MARSTIIVNKMLLDEVSAMVERLVATQVRYADDIAFDCLDGVIEIDTTFTIFKLQVLTADQHLTVFELGCLI